MTDIALYRNSGLDIYEMAHYSHGEHLDEIEAVLSWYGKEGSRLLDLGCGGGLHALELAKRGYRVTGVDLEPSAIALARERCSQMNGAAEFLVADLMDYNLGELGCFNMIYSLGNVISHIRRKRLPALLEMVRSCLEVDGIFLFDVLAISESFQEEISEEDLDIIWQRRLNRKTGEIRLRGIFNRFGVIQDFRVWGYSKEEITGFLREAGFKSIDVSARLDFSSPLATSENPVCLRFRTRTMEEK